MNKFFNTGQICTKQVTSLRSWILSEGRPAMGISFPLYVFFSLKPVRVVFRGELQFFLSLFNFLVSILCCEGLFLLSCSSVFFFFFLVLLSLSSSFLFFCLLLLSCSSVFFFFLVLLSSSAFLFFCLLLLSCSSFFFFFLGFCL